MITEGVYLFEMNGNMHIERKMKGKVKDSVDI